MPAAHPHVLVIRRRYLGDIVLLGPLFRNLRRHWPSAHLAALVEPAYAGVLPLNPDVDEIFTLPQRPGEWPGFVRRLSRAGFTHVLDLDNNERTALLTRLTGASCRIALWHEGSHARWRMLYTADVHDRPEQHERRGIVDYYLAVLGAIGIPVVSREVRLQPKAADLAAAKMLAPPGPRRLLVHPGSRSAWRRWPAEYFAAICDRVQEDLGVQVFVAAGPGEQSLVADIRRHAQTHLVAVDPPPSVPQFAALAAQFDLLLCHDSGPMHVAAAVGTPVVALLGSQNPVLFAPPGEGHVVLQPPLPCTQCVSPGACVPGDSYHNHCVRNISVEQVFHAVKTQLARRPARS